MQAYKGGMPAAEIARLCRCSEWPVYDVLAKQGLTPERPEPLSENSVAELKALRAQGRQIKELATKFGVSRVTVWKKLKGDKHV